MKAAMQSFVTSFTPQGVINSITPQGFPAEYPMLRWPLPTRATEQEDTPDFIAKAPFQPSEWITEYTDIFTRKPSNDVFQFADNPLYPPVVVAAQQFQEWDTWPDPLRRGLQVELFRFGGDPRFVFVQPQGANDLRPDRFSRKIPIGTVDAYPPMGNVPTAATPYGWWPKDFFETLRWWRRANLTVDGYPPMGNVPSPATPYGWWPKDFFEMLRWQLREVGSYNIDAGTPATVYTTFSDVGDDQTIFIKRRGLTVDGFMPMGSVPSPVTPYGWWPKDFFETYRRKFSPALQQYDWLYEATVAVVTAFPEGWRAEYPVALQAKRPIPQFDAAGKAAGAIYLPWVTDAPVFARRRPIVQFDAPGKAQDATYLAWVTDTPLPRLPSRARPGEAGQVLFPGQPQGWAPWFDNARVIIRRQHQFDAARGEAERRVLWGWSAEFPSLIVRKPRLNDAGGQVPIASFQQTWAATYFDMPRRLRRQFVEGFPRKGEQVYPFLQGPQGWQPNFGWVIKKGIIPPDYARNYPRSGVPIIWKPTLIGIDKQAQLVGDDQRASLDGIKTAPTLVGKDEGDDLTGIDRDPNLVGKVGE